jgi:pimeloyl-ACP methyl ester carboxylesterase
MMKNRFRGWLWIVGLLIAAAAGLVLGARAGLLTPDDSTVRARYALADSRFADIDGESVHFVDQGRGPAIVLVHGSFGSLRMWNDWAAQLTPRYRVIRFDRPRMGLSGPSPAGRTGTEQEVRIIAALTNKLGVERFFLVGTSSAGASAAAYAADHPEQVRGLILANIAVGAFTPNDAQRTRTLKFLRAVDPVFKGWRPQEFWRQVLLENFFDKSRVTPELAREWTDLNSRAQRMPPATGMANPMAAFDQTVNDLARMSVPTLLLWSDHDHELPLETTGRRGLRLLGSRDKELQVVANCGHMMPLECGAASAPRALAFFDRILAAGA